MTVIQQTADLCTVIVTLDAEPHLMSELEAHASHGLTQFAQLKGFVSGALHKSADGSRLVQYLQWETEADHLACLSDPRWEQVPSTRRFMEIVDSGQAKLDVKTYTVIAASAAPA